ncbi:MAG: hypothetical protein HGGPFJEG_02372 [Ignavibacteria bacterium]|nr:hypothetical protein [Ignavibacteria bacterium]
MSNNKQKLELTWIGKNNPEYDISNIEPRILEENPELSNCKNDPNTENMIIHGDNLLALKALLPEYEGKVKCIYIDPPYNTGNAFTDYDDNVEHSTWLSLMKPRLELLRLLLMNDGLIFVQIDDNEQAYLKILMDEVFGRENFITNICVKMSHLSGVKMSHVEKKLPKIKEYIMLYSINKDKNKINPIYIQTSWNESLERYNQFIVNIEENYKNWIVKPVRRVAIEQGIDLNSKEVFEKFLIENAKSIFRTARNRSLEVTGVRNKFYQVISARGLSKFVYNDEEVLFAIEKLIEIDGKLVPGNPLGDIWLDIGINNLHNEGGVDFRNGKKPEKLIERILTMSSEKGDLILDSFLGSGTTAAVAHKMNRKYIGIEMGDHAYTHCKVRLDKVIDGTDQGGISKTVEWKGGGAYKFYQLAPSFITKDEFGNTIIDDYYNDTKLIKAMCKLMNFTYKPSQTEYWKHGEGQGKNYLYITTQLLTSGMVQQIAAHLADGESLIICPKKFEPGAEKIDSRITIKKIPQSVLKACQFGKKEYLLPIKETSIEEVEIESDEEEEE